MSQQQRTEAFLRSNPALAIERLVEALRADPVLWAHAAAHLREAIEQLARLRVPLGAGHVASLVERRLLDAPVATPEPPRPGVVALLIDRTPGEVTGVVDPLRAKLRHGGAWALSPLLPVQASQLQWMLSRALRGRGPVAGCLPERFAFELDDGVGLAIEGSSMHVASLLALVDAAGRHEHPRLRAACAVVEPVGHEDELRPVEGADLKLRAFVRELLPRPGDRGSLLVCAPGDPEVVPYRERFEAVWEVDHWDALGAALEKAGLLAPFESTVPLPRAETLALNARFDALLDVTHDFAGAVDLADRMWGRGFADDVGAVERARSLRAKAGALSRLGRAQEATAEARRVRDLFEEARARNPRVVPRDEVLRAAATWGAMAFDLHEFEAIEAALAPWHRAALDDDGALTPDTAAAALNTLGRVWSLTGGGDWERPFRTTLALMRDARGDVTRAWTYLVQALLRAGRAEEADAELARFTAAAPPSPSPLVAAYMAYLVADVARLRPPRRATAPELDALREGALGPRGFPVACYFLATARQAWCPPDERRWRLARAVELLRADARDEEGDVATLAARLVTLAAAGLDGDADAWAREGGALAAFLDRPAAAAMARWYAPLRPSLAGPPTAESAERWLRRCPLW